VSWLTDISSGLSQMVQDTVSNLAASFPSIAASTLTQIVQNKIVEQVAPSVSTSRPAPTATPPPPASAPVAAPQPAVQPTIILQQPAEPVGVRLPSWVLPVGGMAAVGLVAAILLTRKSSAD